MNMTPPTWLDTTTYPFAPKTFQSSSGTISYIDMGSGEPIVFVHGSPDWSYSFRGLIRELSKHYRCIAVDHLGFGLSDKPQQGDYRAEAHGIRLSELIASLSLTNITLLVHDWGGPIGMHYATQHPDTIARIVVLNSWMWPVNKEWYYQMFSGMMGGPLGRFSIRRWNTMVNTVVPMSYGMKSKLTANTRRHLSMPFTRKESRRGLEMFPGAIIKETPWLARIWERRSVLADKPMLIVWGLKDIAYRKKELEQWRAAFPNAEVHIFADAGHFPHEEHPDETLGYVTAFLKS